MTVAEHLVGDVYASALRVAGLGLHPHSVALKAEA
jgi:hypothetical protein